MATRIRNKLTTTIQLPDALQAVATAVAGGGTTTSALTVGQVLALLPPGASDVVDVYDDTAAPPGAAVPTGADSAVTGLIPAALRRTEYLGPLAAAGVNVLAQQPGGAVLAVAAGFVNSCPARTLQVVLGVGGVATVYTVTGTHRGTAVSGTATLAGAGTANVVDGDGDPIAFTTITGLTSDVDPVGTTDLQTGPGYGLVESPAAIVRTGVDGVVEVPTLAKVATATVVPATAPNGAHVFVTEYNVNVGLIDGGHTHTLS